MIDAVSPSIMKCQWPPVGKSNWDLASYASTARRALTCHSERQRAGCLELLLANYPHVSRTLSRMNAVPIRTGLSIRRAVQTYLAEVFRVPIRHRSYWFFFIEIPLVGWDVNADGKNVLGVCKPARRSSGSKPGLFGRFGSLGN